MISHNLAKQSSVLDDVDGEISWSSKVRWASQSVVNNGLDVTVKDNLMFESV